MNDLITHTAPRQEPAMRERLFDLFIQVFAVLIGESMHPATDERT